MNKKLGAISPTRRQILSAGAALAASSIGTAVYAKAKIKGFADKIYVGGDILTMKGKTPPLCSSACDQRRYYSLYRVRGRGP